ncbi:MAG: flagellin [Propionivibrio sp.]
MAAQINTNLYSLNAQRNLSKNSSGLQTAIERLSSGLRVNSAKDDAAGLAVAMKMDSFARSISASIRISNDKISLAQVGDGALSTVNDMLQRMSELASASANTTLGTTEIGYLSDEYASLATSIDTVVGNAKMNGTDPFASNSITLSAAVASALGTDAAAGGSLVSAALDEVAAARSTLGAVMNNEQYQIQAYESNYENQMAAKSRIMDADFAAETSSLARYQILQQAGTAMVAQANQIPQNVLSLLK